MKLSPAQQAALNQMVNADAKIWYGGYFVTTDRSNSIAGNTMRSLAKLGLVKEVTNTIKQKFTLTAAGRKKLITN